MTYDEALEALERAHRVTMPKPWQNSVVHDGITQVIEVFKRMKVDLDQYKTYQKDWDELIDGMED